MAAGTPMSGLGGLFYILMMIVGIFVKKYDKLRKEPVLKYIVISIVILTISLLLFGAITGFKVFNTN
jgi:hypothetical protein